MQKRLLTLTLCGTLLSFGCKDSGGDDSSTDDSNGTDDSNSTAAERGLPEGESTWSGNVEVGGYPFLIDITFNNSGGDLTSEITFSDDPDTPLGIGSQTQKATGTHEPVGGMLALSPGDWVGGNAANLELLGAIGTYNPDTQTISGFVVDYATSDENNLQGGAFSIAWVSGDGEPTQVGALGEALSQGAHTASGTTQCSASVRDVQVDFDYDGKGYVEGSLLLGDTSLDTPLGTFEVSGVHNPSTGGLTLVPGLWISSTKSVLTFFVDGTYAASTGAYTGSMGSNTNACPPNTWNTTIE